MSRMRILLTGGGTGGHMYPLIAVAAELQVEAIRKGIGIRVRYMGATSKDYRALLRSRDVEIRKVLGSKFRRYASIQNFLDVPRLFLSVFQALWKVYLFMPDVVFSKGGPGSIPVVLAARFYRIPVVIHESDSVPSLTAKITSRFAKVITVSFESIIPYFENRRGRITLTGNPIRRSLLTEPMTQKKAKAFLGFNVELPLIFFQGGSQGAQFINDFVLDNLKKLLPLTQILHQTGLNNYKNVIGEYAIIEKELKDELKGKYKAVDSYSEDIKIALTACDLVVSRSGAGGIFEIAAFRKPSIIIPITSSSDRHYETNAIEYGKTGAALVFEEKNLLPNLFLERIEELFGDPNKLIQMSKATSEFYMPNAALNLAQILLTIKEE